MDTIRDISLNLLSLLNNYKQLIDNYSKLEFKDRVKVTKVLQNHIDNINKELGITVVKHRLTNLNTFFKKNYNSLKYED